MVIYSIEWMGNLFWNHPPCTLPSICFNKNHTEVLLGINVDSYFFVKNQTLRFDLINDFDVYMISLLTKNILFNSVRQILVGYTIRDMWPSHKENTIKNKRCFVGHSQVTHLFIYCILSFHFQFNIKHGWIYPMHQSKLMHVSYKIILPYGW